MLKLLCSPDWVVISAFATASMAVATFVTLIQNRRQLKELKRQWQDEHKAKLMFSIAVVNGHWYCLRIENIGKAIAENITFSINETFISKLLLNSCRDNLKSFSEKAITILPGQHKQFMISPTRSDNDAGGNSKGQIYTQQEANAQLEKIMNIPIKINGQYNKKDVISECFTMGSFFRNSIVEKDKIETQLEKIAEILKKQSRQ